MAEKLKRILQVEGSTRTVDGESLPYSFTIDRRRPFGGVGRKEAADVVNGLTDLPGTLERVHIVRTNKKGEEVGRQSAFMLGGNLGQEVTALRASRDLEAAKHTAASLKETVLQTEQDLNKQLVEADEALGVSGIRMGVAQNFMYPPGDSMEDVVAHELMSDPDKAIRKTVKYLRHNHLNHPDKRVSTAEKAIDKVLLPAAGLVPVLGGVVTLTDNLNSLVDLGKVRTWRGKGFQWASALTSDIVQGLLEGIEITGVGLPVGEIATPLNYKTFDPLETERAVMRVDDQRYTLEAKTAIQLLSPDSGISPAKRRDIAFAVRRQIGNGVIKQAEQVESSEEGRPRAEYAKLVRDLRLAA